MLIHNIRRPALPLALTTMLGISVFGAIVWRYNTVSARYTKNINQMQAYHLAYSTADAVNHPRLKPWACSDGSKGNR